jgi:hypothetical protein
MCRHDVVGCVEREGGLWLKPTEVNVSFVGQLGLTEFFVLSSVFRETDTKKPFLCLH